MRPLKFVTWNVHKCVGRDGRFDPERIVSVLAELEADVVALQEADARFGRRHGLLDDALLARHGLRRLEVCGNTEASHGWCGNVLLVSSRVQASRATAVVMPGLEPRGALVADMVLPGGKDWRVVSCHLGLLPGCRRRQVEEVTKHLLRHRTGDALLMGDTNEWRRDSSPRSALHGMTALGLRGRRTATFPSLLPILGLDRILASRPGYFATPRGADSRMASDHIPLVMECAA